MPLWYKTVLKDTATHIAGVRCGQALYPVVPRTLCVRGTTGA
ncbi:MAG: hypothetical protein AAFR89_00715 [Cyanobacteria bacterium J06633_1]